MSGNREPSAGVTVLELVVAVAVAGLLGLAAGRSLAVLAGTERRAEQQWRAQESVYLALGRLAGEIARAGLGLVPGEEAFPAAAADSVAVQYRAGNPPQLVVRRFYLEQPAPGGVVREDRGGGAVLPLTDSAFPVTGLHFRYFAAGGTPLDPAQLADAGARALIRRVEITLAVDADGDGTTDHTETTAVRILNVP